MNIDQLRENLLFAPKNGYTQLTARQREEMEAYCKRYTAFLDACKTEREATAWTVATCQAHGFQELKPGMDLKPGDKPEAVFALADGETVVAAYEYCNLHGLWKAEA